MILGMKLERTQKSKDIWHQIIVNLKNTWYKIGMQLESNLDYCASFLIYYTNMI